MDSVQHIDPQQGGEVDFMASGGLSYWSARLLNDRVQTAAWGRQHAVARDDAVSNDEYVVDSEPDLPA